MNFLGRIDWIVKGTKREGEGMALEQWERFIPKSLQQNRVERTVPITRLERMNIFEKDNKSDIGDTFYVYESECRN